MMHWVAGAATAPDSNQAPLSRWAWNRLIWVFALLAAGAVLEITAAFTK